MGLRDWLSGKGWWLTDEEQDLVDSIVRPLSEETLRLEHAYLLSRGIDMTAPADSSGDHDQLDELDRLVIELALHHPLVDGPLRCRPGSKEYAATLAATLAWARGLEAGSGILEEIREGRIGLRWDDYGGEPRPYRLQGHGLKRRRVQVSVARAFAVARWEEACPINRLDIPSFPVGDASIGRLVSTYEGLLRVLVGLGYRPYIDGTDPEWVHIGFGLSDNDDSLLALMWDSDAGTLGENPSEEWLLVVIDQEGECVARYELSGATMSSLGEQAVAFIENHVPAEA